MSYERGTIVSIRADDIHGIEGRLVEATTERIAHDAAGHLGVR